MDFQPYRFETFEGLPPDGEPGQFFGFDANGAVFVLRWGAGQVSGKGCWIGMGFDPGSIIKAREAPLALGPLAFLESLPEKRRIVAWARAPWCDLDTPAEVDEAAQHIDGQGGRSDASPSGSASGS